MASQSPNIIPPTKPVRLPAAATLSLPRWGILLLCLLYIVPGLIGRDPWKTSDVTDFTIMWTMASGTWEDWLLPNISGLPIFSSGPMTYWLGAIFITLFGGLLGNEIAARLATLLFFLLGAYSIWRTGYLLGQRQETQPMKLAFGGQPDTKAYGRVLADSALLVYLASLGLLSNSHETSVEALFVSTIAYCLYRSTRYVNDSSIKNAIYLGLAIGFLVLTNGLVVPVGLYVFLFIGVFFYRSDLAKHISKLLLALATTSLIVAIWYIVLNTTQPYGQSPFWPWLSWHTTQFGLPTFSSLFYFFKRGMWFFWPAWPYALWSIYAWRKQWHSAHVILPLVFCVTFLVLAIFNPHPEESAFLSFLPPFAILAVLGLPTMKRGAINAIDWFSVMSLTLIGLFIWLAWIAHSFGWPAQLAKNATKLAPGFLPQINLFAVLIACIVTLAWFALVYWRISRQPSVLWRAVVLSTGGVILCWVLLGTLWLPWINYNKSYRSISLEMSKHITGPNSCVTSNINPALRASFAYFGHIHFSGPLKAEKECRYTLLRDRVPKRKRQAAPKTYKNMSLVWEGHRPSDRQERFRLYRAD